MSETGEFPTTKAEDNTRTYLTGVDDHFGYVLRRFNQTRTFALWTSVGYKALELIALVGIWRQLRKLNRRASD